ncbi:hypothetical protein E1295_30230 [Nonomuraea mesophila]|uniref:Uncharacterized protein n=1 Tax=Nonomuraea mesophila TaxID=2530382 RepID=A0A4R5F1Z0_9ACTN|nr:hypothetical protein [Nonomuraea mesophila]TDE41433.1 hypothetical protein E1295_30230 [Nonomuraea mesophila]
MMYGPPPPPEYPRATSSPTIILLVSGLAALLGFLLGVFVGFGASTPAQAPPAKITVTTEVTGAPEPTAPTQPVPSQEVPSQPVPSQPVPSQPVPSESEPSQPVPSQSVPSQPVPSQSGPAQGGGVSTAPAGNPASLRTLVVGRDIQPGTYRTSGPAGGFSMCYWARLRSTDGDVIATGMPTGAATVTVETTDKAFQTGGCAEWTAS